MIQFTLGQFICIKCRINESIEKEEGEQIAKCGILFFELQLSLDETQLSPDWIIANGDSCQFFTSNVGVKNMTKKQNSTTGGTE